MPVQIYTDQVVSLGSHVHVRDIETGEREVYTITRPRDADIRRNCISTLSPIGKALYGQRPGHVVSVQAPGGTFLVEIEAVEHVPAPQHTPDK